MSALGDTALGYARRKWPVFPAEPRGKRPLTAHGFKDATAELGQVERWWARWPDANIAIPTGVAFDVLDVDGPVGKATVSRWLATHRWPRVPIVHTGRGMHFLFAPTGTGNRTGLADGIDWRGAGGYVIAAGSVHPSGRRYRWRNPQQGRLGQPVPPWLLDLLFPPPRAVTTARRPLTLLPGGRYARAAVAGETEEVRRAPVGQRNHTLYLAALKLGSLVGAGALEAGMAAPALLAAALDVGLGEREARATILSGLNAGASSPRQGVSA